MSEIGELVERMRALQRELSAVAAVRLLSATDEELCALTVAVEEAGRLTDALRVASAGEIGERSAPGLGHDGLAFRLGLGRAVLLVAALTRCSNAEAARRLRLGAAIRPRTTLDGTVLDPAHPAVATALRAGGIGVEAAARIVRALDEAARVATDEQIARAESELVDAAVTDTADEIGVQAIVWREFLDQDGAEPREARAHRKRSFRFGAERNGLVPFSGQMELLGAALLKEAFEEAFRGSTPRFLAEADGGEYVPGGYLDGQPAIHPDGEPLTALETAIAKDSRSTEQRQHDVLTGLITAGIRSTGSEPGGMRSTAQVTAVITLDELRTGKGVGWVEGITEPLSASAIQKLVQASGYATLVEGDNGETLFLTKHNRLFTWQQTRALLVRDGGCVWPGCNARAGGCEAHHVIPWPEGGPTTIDNGVLLCPHHHAMLPHSGYSMRMIRGKPYLLAPPWIDPDQKWIALGKSRLSRLTARHRKAE